MQNNLISYRQFARRCNGLTDKKKSFKQKFIFSKYLGHILSYLYLKSQEIVYLYESYTCYMYSMYVLKLLFEMN